MADPRLACGGPGSARGRAGPEARPRGEPQLLPRDGLEAGWPDPGVSGQTPCRVIWVPDATSIVIKDGSATRRVALRGILPPESVLPGRLSKALGQRGRKFLGSFVANQDVYLVHGPGPQPGPKATPLLRRSWVSRATA